MKVGDKLVCISSEVWTVGFGPKKDEIVTICRFGTGVITGKEILIFSEYDKGGAGYYPKYFRPLLGQSATAELVSSFIEITETSDLPIRSPQPTEPCGS